MIRLIRKERRAFWHAQGEFHLPGLVYENRFEHTRRIVQITLHIIVGDSLVIHAPQQTAYSKMNKRIARLVGEVRIIQLNYQVYIEIYIYIFLSKCRSVI